MSGVDAQVASAPARDIGPYLDPDVPLSAQGAPEDTEPQDIGPALDPDASPKREQ